jgi:lipopolysaccharide export system protein LptA
MDEITIFLKYTKITFCRRCIPVAFFILIIPVVCGQTEQKSGVQKRKVELIHADEYKPDDKMGRELGRFVGNVSFRDPVNGMIMTCDSSYFWQSKNQLKSYGRVHVEQGDTLDIYGDYLFYDGAEQTASLEGNVTLKDKETQLDTRSIRYDVRQKIARYTENGKITNGDNTLTSILGTYDVSNKLFHFKDSIKIVNPDFIMKADTMDYNTVTETVFFKGPSEVIGDSIYMFCERGWYDTKNDIASIWKNALIDNRQQVIRGDSLFYNDSTGFGEAFNNIEIQDTTNSVIVRGDYAWYYKDPERFQVTKRALFIQVASTDSLFLHSDTISSVTVTDSAGIAHRLMRSWRNCRIFSRDLQAKCDSLSYFFLDSVIRLYYKPVIWSEANQLTSDSMAIFTKNMNADRLELYNSAFVAGKVDSLRFDQIKGRNLTGLFMDNKLYKLLVEGNGESIYHLVDQDKLIGVTHNKSSSIEILVVDGKIDEIIERENPDGKLDPPLLNPPDKMKLPGFNWLDSIRPKKMEDIFKSQSP